MTNDLINKKNLGILAVLIGILLFVDMTIGVFGLVRITNQFEFLAGGFIALVIAILALGASQIVRK